MSPLRKRYRLASRRARREAGVPGVRGAHKRRGVLLAQVLVLVLFATLTARMWYMQVPQAGHYHELALASHTQKLIVPAVRGKILDSQGRPLVRNRTELTVTADFHTLLNQPDDGAAVLRRVAEVLDVPFARLRDRVRLCGPDTGRPCWPGSPYQPIPLAEDIDPRVALQIMERKTEFPGISAQQMAVRDYPNGDMAAQMLGYLQPITQEEFEAREELRAQFSGVDQVGRDGLEYVYDDRLRGTAGTRTLAVTSQGGVNGVVEETPPKPGMHLVTSIDQKVQRITEDALKAGVERARSEGRPTDSGAAVVLDVRTGNVIAMASLPTYDPSVWQGGIDQATYDQLLSEDAGEPLISRALQGQFPPGSTFKVSSLSAAVRNGADLDGTYSCPGSVHLGNRSWQNFEGGGHGSVSLHKAIVVSCNTVFYQFGYDTWLQDGGTSPKDDPKEIMADTARGFGFGQPTGIDLPHESSGRIPDRQWKQQYWEDTREQSCRRAEKGYPEVAEEDPGHAAYLKRAAHEHCLDGNRWRAGDAINFAIGQGDVLVTPLQLARAYAAIANGGTLYEPRVARGFLSADGTRVEELEPVKAGTLPIDDRTLEYLQRALTQVPKEGTARGAFDGFPQDKVSIAGKTGTATMTGSEDSAWFASYAPADDPQFAVVAMLPEAGTGGVAAAPVVREIYEGIYGISGAEPGAGGDAKPKVGEPAMPGAAPPEELPRVRSDGTVAPPPDTGD
ncbi:penicillin-binding protein 2 [Streptomonospora nanhaiensis]|uniref:Penicillin-binding protein 2 n=1 Tax=Streptomonospora nanhaiensis TaxID=1323731 RepID=A0A853BU62_9ACTN|nr:penicillin-binding protein 2 [Streptomonospora nanhaiensis]MBV2363494.1 penicillin-binding protein 2 [Streptomonospora nanhaiensis]MBX9389705.1 penicillin-binding protein 2 [Streptomonospora nanhaiensis]NYI98504.1 penicillin-binding protein 2 [Streptomonospora nanhaiensis]